MPRLSPLWQGKADQPRRGAGDVALYRAEVDRIRNGESYYQATAAELTARGYPTQSVFNWRMPLPMWFIGQLPQAEWAKYILAALSLGLIVLAFEALARDQGFEGKGDSPLSMGSRRLGSGTCRMVDLFCMALLACLRHDCHRRSGASTQMDPIRRGGICLGHRPNERLSAIIATVGNSAVFRRGDVRTGRLAYTIWHAHRLDHLCIRDCFCNRRSRFQPVLGLDHRPPVVLRRSPSAGFDLRPLAGGEYYHCFTLADRLSRCPLAAKRGFFNGFWAGR